VTNTLAIALVVAVIGPVILSLLTGRQRRREKILDWAREDEVARKAAQVAQDLRDSQRSTDFQLERIHTLVNSNMTAQMEDSLASKKAELAALLEVADLKRAAGVEPSSTALSTINLIKSDIARKEAELADRLAATKKAAAPEEAD
jgi:hypothetical protein